MEKTLILYHNKSKQFKKRQNIERSENCYMLTEERFSIILNTVNQKRSVKFSELCEILGASLSTVRRDVSTLEERGLLIKVHGGAIALSEDFTLTEKDIAEKSKLFSEEKELIARYAASLIDNGDFVFIDAGTTTEKMINFLPKKEVVFVTTGIIHAKKLAQRGFRVYIPGGEIKLSTEAIVGADCVYNIGTYNFTKSFIGTNGISLVAGFSTPDINEARVKAAAMDKSTMTYILADHSKFDKVTSVTFAGLNSTRIITDRLPDKKYVDYTSVKEVM